MIGMLNKKGMNKRTFRYQYAIIFGLTAILPLLLFLFVVDRYGIVQEPKVALILGASLAIAMMGFMFSLRIIKQVTILAQDFIRVERGELKELGERAISSEISEMARIADSFNRTLAELKTQTRELEDLFGKLNTLSELTTLVSRIPNIKEVLEVVLHRTMGALNARIGSIMLLDHKTETLKIECAEGLDESIVSQTVLRLGEKIAGKVALTGEAIVVEDVEQNPSLQRTNDTKYEGSSFICMPLLARGKVMGVLNLSKRADKGAFTQSDLAFLKSLLSHIGFALENASLIEEAKGRASRLEQVVDDQSSQLSQIRKKVAESTILFQQAQKMEAVGTLAGGIAHDFNNLLMGIQGHISLMLKDIATDHPQYEHLIGIENITMQGADLTKQLLGFARDGRYEVKPINVNKLIKDQNSMFQRTRKEVTIYEEYEKNVWTIEVDPVQIDQVLLNLYLNACQAMPGGGDLYVRTENRTLDADYTSPFQASPGRYVKISVTDTGVGMDKATRQRIFEPFFTTKEVGTGTGLGLAATYGIIKNHGGFINVSSEKSQGATFDIYLPASDKEVTEYEELSMSEDILGGTETVLLVDDEDIILEVGNGMFTSLGYTVMLAPSGEKAIEIYSKNQDKIDVVILDMVMPGIGGGQLYDKLKEINPTVKTLLSSGYSINGQANDILQRGCDGFIQKPFNLKQLSSKLREVLDRQ